VLAKRQAGRAAACKWQLLHFEKRNNVLVESGIVPELFDKIEKNGGREGLQFLPYEVDLIVDGEMLRSVTELTQRGHNVRLRLPVLRFQLLCEVLIELGRTCAVKEHQNFEFLLHDFLVSVIPSVGSARVSRAGFGVAPKRTFSELSLR
jgi:hypothetical protein